MKKKKKEMKLMCFWQKKKLPNSILVLKFEVKFHSKLCFGESKNQPKLSIVVKGRVFVLCRKSFKF